MAACSWGSNSKANLSLHRITLSPPTLILGFTQFMASAIKPSDSEAAMRSQSPYKLLSVKSTSRDRCAISIENFFFSVSTNE